jgi:hypothetical protein
VRTRAAYPQTTLQYKYPSDCPTYLLLEMYRQPCQRMPKRHPSTLPSSSPRAFDTTSSPLRGALHYTYQVDRGRSRSCLCRSLNSFSFGIPYDHFFIS